MAEFFGDLERLAADLYPYRWPILAGVLVVLAAIGTYGYRRQWHFVVWERRRVAIIVGTPLLALAGFLAWDLGGVAACAAGSEALPGDRGPSGARG